MTEIGLLMMRLSQNVVLRFSNSERPRDYVSNSVWVFLLLICLSLDGFGQKPRLVVETGHFGQVNALQFSRDNGLLMSKGGGGTTFWSVERGKELRTLPELTMIDKAQPMFSTAFDLDQRLMAGAQNETINIWNIDDGARLNSFTTGSEVTRLAIKPAQRILASSHKDNVVRIWDLKKNSEAKTLPESVSPIRELYFTPDGKSLVTLEEDLNIRIWDTTTYVNTLTLKSPGTLILREPIVISPDSRTLAGINGEAVFLWNLVDVGEPASFALKGTERSYPFVFSNDSKTLIGGNDDGIVFRNLPSGTVERGLKIPGRLESLALSSNNKLAAGNDAGLIKLWDLNSGDASIDLVGHTGFIQQIRFSNGGNTIQGQIDDGPGKFFDVLKGRFMTPKLSQGFRAIAISPDQRYVAAQNNLEFALFDPFGKRLQLANDGRVGSCAFSPDGKLIAAGAYNPSLEEEGEVRVWDTATGKELPALSGGLGGIVPFVNVTFSPDGKTIMGNIEDSVTLWDIKTWKKLFTLKKDLFDIHLGQPVFGPDSKQLFILNSGQVNVFELPAGKKTKTYALNVPYNAYSFAFNSDGKLLALGSEEALIKLWDLESGKELASMSFLDDKDWAVATPEGRFDASETAQKLMHWIVRDEPIDLEQLKEEFYEPYLLAKLMGFNSEPLRSVTSFTDVKLFPSVEWSPPLPGETKLNIRLTNRGGGIGQVQVLVNGKEVIADARPANFDPHEQRANLTVDLKTASIIAGQPNSIRVVAWNYDSLTNRGYVSSRGDPVSWVPGVGATADLPELYAIVAGISDYSSPRIKLHFAAKDAESIATALELGGNRLFGTGKVHLKLLTSPLTDARASPPTKENFRKAFADFKTAKPNDVLVIYLAGHGISLRTGNDLYLYLTQDARTTDSGTLASPAIRDQMSISSEELVEWIKQVPALKQVLVLDTCAAGAANAKLMEQRDLPSDTIRAIERLKDRTGFHVLLGSAADASSYEASQYGQGLLTYALLQGMRGPALRPNGELDVQAVFQFAADQVPLMAKGIGGIQRPEVRVPSGGESFPIGLFTNDDRKLVPMAQVKPLMLLPTLQNRDRGFDDLQLGLALKTVLRDKSESLTSSNNSPPFIYFETDELPGAIHPSGLYTIRGDEIEVTIHLIRDQKDLTSLVINGVRGDINQLSEKIAQAMIGFLKNKPD